MRRVAHYLNGQLRDDGEVVGPLYDPATGEVAAEVPFASGALVNEAVSAARAAADTWRDSTLTRRTQVMFSFRELLKRGADELARLVSAEHGKTFADALGEVSRGIENVEYACGVMEHLKGQYSMQVSEGVDVSSTREPVGIVAAITPFNFPAMVPLWMIANAVVTGNSVVLKPSERDPSTAVRLAELLSESGLPDGVLNVVHGDSLAVESLLADPRVDAVSFVGSTRVARHVHDVATAAGKRVQALGGAKNHMVILADADLDAAADAAVSAAFGSAGERCMAVSVVVAVDQVADEVVARIAERVDGLRVGPGSDPSSDFGPLITREHRDRVASYVESAVASGATIVRDGRDLVDRPGFYLGPTVVDGAAPGMACYDDEIFGPFLCVARVGSLDEAISLVNANRYGNGVAVFTRDGGAARRFSRSVSVGMIGVNVAVPVPVASFSFGGWKDSLFGHSHIYGPEGINFYTRAKVVTSRWPDGSGTGLDLGFPQNR